MHTQKAFAKFLVEEKESDFVFMVKENQPTLLEDIRTQHAGSFFPSGEHEGQGARANRDSRDLDLHRPGRVSEVPPCQDDVPPRSAGLESRRNAAAQGDGVRDHELGGQQ